MPFPRFRILSLMIVVAIVVVILAGVLLGSEPVAILGVFLVAASPFLAFFYYLARKLGLNTLFR